MLEKNKDYVEFTLQSTRVDYRKIKDHPAIDFHGYSDSDFPGVPMDVVCKRSGHRVVMISKRDFEALQTENEQLKKKLEEFSPAPGYGDFLKALYPEVDVEKFVWATKQLCCGRDLRHALQVDLEFYRTFSSCQAKSIHSWKEATECDSPEEAEKKIENLKELDQCIDDWQKATGFSSPEEIRGYLTNETYCNTLCDVCEASHLRIKDQISTIEKWQKATGCYTPGAVKKLIDNLAKKAINYESRLNKAKQSASIAIRHLDNIVFRDDKYPDLTDGMAED